MLFGRQEFFAVDWGLKCRGVYRSFAVDCGLNWYLGVLRSTGVRLVPEFCGRLGVKISREYLPTLTLLCRKEWRKSVLSGAHRNTT